MRRSLLLVLALTLAAVSCGNETSTLTASDELAEASSESDSAPATTTAVAGDSAPIELGPTTTAHWEDTLVDYPLLTLLDDRQDAAIGSAAFVLVDQNNVPIFSGAEQHPEFLIRIDAWYGTNNYIEFTVSTSNVRIVDGRPESHQCGSNWAGFSILETGQMRRTPDRLPEVSNAQLAWPSVGCVDDLPVAYDSLLDSDVGVMVTEDGLAISSLTSRLSRFRKLDPPAAVATTELPQTTALLQTTTTGPPAD